MRARDTFDVLSSMIAVLADAVAVYAGFMLAAWIRFDSGWIPMHHEGLPPRELYYQAGGVIAILFVIIFKTLDLYVRPQTGTFSEKIPRLVRATGLGVLMTTALSFGVQPDPPLSRYVVAISFGTIGALVLVQRFLIFRIEIALARRQRITNRVIILGTDAIAARLKSALEREPRLRTEVIAFLRLDTTAPEPAIPADLIRGDISALKKFLEDGAVDQVILSNQSALTHDQMANIILDCEQAMVEFDLVPDLYRLLTFSMEMITIDGIPVLGTEKWPLDHFWNRAAKRGVDIAGAIAGLALSALPIAFFALLIKRSSPGPVFFRQERCGEKGQPFTIFKLRTMPVDAEAATGPVWAAEEDPRRTGVGVFLRRHNLDELPQFWNVLIGEMSLVGPRPERPHFVEQFKEDISRYMWRHVFKPGMTGWAQVNGLRGNTSIQDRIRYDLFYLEKWSLSLDFKILARTFFSRKNAY
ncbi:MAG TPA: exopolysaccharide biosynthesis polyprenyl glycosylphosphotransferase [Kiritimatiellia bacterium]|jgi:exopolysaccharide biosynthesis polyprenyl glycosylphosphotransferase